MPKITHQSFSFSQNAWRRLKKNEGAMVGLVIIFIAILTGTFAYFIANDTTPNADRQIVEIQAKKPGYKQLFIKVKKEKSIPNTNFFQRLLYGKEDAFNLIPINTYQGKGDSIIIQKFIDDGVEDRISIPKSKLFSKNYIVAKTFWLGTDRFGRDILSRLIVGVRVSLAVGLITVLISLTIGVILGSLAGYFRGKTDNIIMWLINVIWSIPTLLLVFGITLALGKGFWQIFIAVGLTMWVSVARLIRGQAIALREMEYIQAAKALGIKDMRIIVRHILPNVMGPVIVIAASNFATAIIVEAGLSFLGVGVQPPQPSWGLMIKENYNFIITHNPMLALAPGFAIMILVLAFNLLGNGLRDALDVKGKV
ncbi:MAG TPA: ABC transporter permease [Chitinophagaceae bacterium]|nr:ABC transporter permease [Chitinophagaceae bacterium]